MRIGPFKLDRRLGHGGMATVWGGVHVELGTAVALKFLRPGKTAVRSTVRFLDETRALARMNHPGIVRVYETGLCPQDVADQLGDDVEARAPYLVMEAIGGGTLRHEHLPDWETCQRTLLALIDALGHAHARDVLHRDVKPSNILIDEFGVVRLTDFGIARLARSKAVFEKVTGTPSYMAPEQITSQGTREGPWTDLYAIGCLAFWMITGSPPYEGTVSQILSGHVSGTPASFEPRFAVPPEAEDWCMRMLEKDPQGRFTRAADAAWALSLLDTEVAPGTPGPDDTIPDAVSGDSIATATVVFGHLTPESRVPSGAAADNDIPPPPAEWQTPMPSGRGQLLSSGPGMLTHREPLFRGRLEERTRLWEILGQTWEEGGDVSIGLTGPEGVGRRSLIRWFGRRAHETGSVHVLEFPTDVQSAATEQMVHWWNEVGGRPGAMSFYVRHGDLDELARWDLEQIEELAEGEDVAGPALSAIHARWTARRSRERIVLYVSDDPAVATLFDAARSIAPARRILVVPTPEEGNFDVTLRLPPLGSEEIEAILADLLGLSNRAARLLASHADGNPGAATEWARLAAREGLLVPGERGLELPERAAKELVDDFDSHWLAAAESLPATTLRSAFLLATADSTVGGHEFADVCGYVGIDPDVALPELASAGLVSVEHDSVHFAHPAARRAILATHGDDGTAHEALYEIFERPPETPRRAKIAMHHGFHAGRVDVDELVEAARALRARAHVEQAIELLSGAVEALSAGPARRRVCVELAECQLNDQNYAAASEALDMLDGGEGGDDVRALRLFLALRRLEDVKDELLEIDAEHLSETACRMVAYAWMDLGKFERARETLLTMDATYDPPGRLYAFARLNFLQEEWDRAAHFGKQAAVRFREIGRPDGALAAMDIVASAVLELGEHQEATQIYRNNLRGAERLGAPQLVQRYNLAVCLLKGEELTDEVDALLEEVVAEALQRARPDLEHCGRAAQVLYAVRIKNKTLARHRIELLEQMELGPWLQTDSQDLLERAFEESSGLVRRDLALVLERVDDILGS